MKEIRLNTKKINENLKDAFFLQENGDSFKALDFFLQIQEEICDIGNIYTAIAICYENMGNIKKAVEAYKVALSIQTKNYYLSNYLGNLCYNLKLYEDSSDYFLLSLKQNSFYSHSWTGLGYSELALDNYSKANDAFFRAVEIDQNSVNAHIGIAKCLLALNQDKEALPYAKKALQLDPDRQEILVMVEQLEKTSKFFKKQAFISKSNRPTIDIPVRKNGIKSGMLFQYNKEFSE